MERFRKSDNNLEQYLTVRDLAHITGWDRFTIYRKSLAGEIPGKTKLGRSLRFKRSAIEAWLRNAEKAGVPKSKSSA